MDAVTYIFGISTNSQNGNSNSSTSTTDPTVPKTWPTRFDEPGCKLAREFEDAKTAQIAEWSDVEKATIYMLLNTVGMDLHKSRNIRLKANLTG